MHVLAEIAWNPEIRNILSLGLGITVLVGSVLLLVSTNAGPRTGTLIVIAGLLGWMTIMGATWWMYGIGMKGTPSHWRVIEINKGDLATAENPEARKLPEIDEAKIVAEILDKHPDLAKKANPDSSAGKVISISELVELDPALKDEFKLDASDLGGWRILIPSDKQRGDAQAVADAALGADGQKLFADSSKYKVVEAYDIGGKRALPADTGDCKWYSPSSYSDCKTRLWDDIYSGIIQFNHPEHFAIVQVQPVVLQETLPGQAPPPPKFDETQPVYSIIMIRSLGDLRFPGFMVFLISGTMFALTCNTLHRRDKLQAANRAAAVV
jgi:hypothetical protein